MAPSGSPDGGLGVTKCFFSRRKGGLEAWLQMPSVGDSAWVRQETRQVQGLRGVWIQRPSRKVWVEITASSVQLSASDDRGVEVSMCGSELRKRNKKRKFSSGEARF